MTEQQKRAIALLCGIVVDAVREAGEQGAPAGPMYAALMAHGFTLEQFESLMSALVLAGKLTRKGHLYFAV